jgi:hypothetical protein
MGGSSIKARICMCICKYFFGKVKDMIAHVLQPTGEEKTDSGNKSERTNLSFAGAIQSTLYKAEMASKMFMFQ